MKTIHSKMNVPFGIRKLFVFVRRPFGALTDGDGCRCE